MSEATASPDVEIPDPYSIPLHSINVAQAALFQRNLQGRYFERLRKEDPVHYCAESPFGAYLVGDEIQRHHARRYASPGVLVRRRHHARTAGRNAGSAGHAHADVHRDGSAETRRAARHREPGGGTAQPRHARKHDSRARRRHSRFAAAQPDVQLGGAGVDRTHDADARDAVRFSVRGSVQTDALVRCRNGRAGFRHRRVESAAPRRTDGMPRVLHASVERARERAAGTRPHFHARARRVDTKHAADGIPRQSDSADRRRQRHHAQFHQRRRARAQRKPAAVSRNYATICR